MRQRALFAFLIYSFAASAWAQQTCTSTSIGCGASISGRLENSGCRFSDSDWPLASYYFDAVSGDVIDIFLESSAFRPYLRLVRDVNNQTLAEDDGISIAAIRYDIQYTGRYRIVVAGMDNARSGLYRLSRYCDRVCRAPFATGPTAVRNVAVGERAAISANADGSPAMHYRWYDAANPAVTIGEDAASITTPPNFTNTSYWVEVTNPCGKSTMFAAFVSVSGTCEAVQITDISKDQHVTRGSSTTLFVTTTGTKPYTYEWFEGAAGDTSLKRGTGATLTVLDVQSKRTFWVRVSNGCGSISSGAITITPTGRRRSVTP